MIRHCKEANRIPSKYMTYNALKLNIHSLNNIGPYRILGRQILFRHIVIATQITKDLTNVKIAVSM